MHSRTNQKKLLLNVEKKNDYQKKKSLLNVEKKIEYHIFEFSKSNQKKSLLNEKKKTIIKKKKSLLNVDRKISYHVVFKFQKIRKTLKTLQIYCREFVRKMKLIKKFHVVTS